jgi:hypothetical protein
LALVDIQPPDGRRFKHHVVRLETVAFAVGSGRELANREGQRLLDSRAEVVRQAR